ncbi:MAG: zinc ribbon domain-containing protein [Nitrososphaerota archaeon]
MFCPKCGVQLPDDAKFCYKCGSQVVTQQQPEKRNVIAPNGVTSIKCPSCGAPLSPKFGEMLVTCEYCGSSVSLGSDGWASVEKQTMLPIKFTDREQVVQLLHGLMDRGLLHRHLQESSVLEELNLSIVPYWVVSVSARTSVVASDMGAEVGTIATTAALMGVMGGAIGGGRRGFGGGLFEGALVGSVIGSGSRGYQKAYQLDQNYNYPVVALKALTEYQPRDYQFNMDDRTIFDIAKVPKGVKILNGDISEDAAKYQAKTYVDQLQSQKAHQQYHMIQQIHTEMDVADAELLHVPVWFARYDHKGKKIVLVLDGNSGNTINSIGL